MKENGSIWITRYSPYSTIFVDKKGDFLSGVDAVIPPGEEINSGIVRFIPYFQLNSYVPATFHVYSNSQFIGYYPLENTIGTNLRIRSRLIILIR